MRHIDIRGSTRYGKFQGIVAGIGAQRHDPVQHAVEHAVKFGVEAVVFGDLEHIIVGFIESMQDRIGGDKHRQPLPTVDL